MENVNHKSLALTIRLLYPLWILLAIFGVAYVPSIIFIQDDSISTAINVSANGMLFRLSILASIATQILHAYIPFYLYLLFEKVNKSRARLMLILALISIPLTMGFDVFKLVALHIEDPVHIYNLLNLSHNGLIISSILWGLWLFPLGKLILESNYFPKIFGYILLLACFGYMLGSIIKIIYPTASTLLIIFEAFTFGEVVFALWVIIKGIRTSL